MISFITESAICMAVLLAVYHLLLKKEKMHKFNRFYLLFSLVVSLAVPCISIPVYTETITGITDLSSAIKSVTVATTPAPEETDYMLYAIIAVYIAVAVVLAFRFIKNIYIIYKKIGSGTLVRFQHARLVLLDEKTVPHTFADYIFLNKKDYTSNRIERELYIHELTL